MSASTRGCQGDRETHISGDGQGTESHRVVGSLTRFDYGKSEHPHSSTLIKHVQIFGHRKYTYFAIYIHIPAKGSNYCLKGTIMSCLFLAIYICFGKSKFCDYSVLLVDYYVAFRYYLAIFYIQKIPHVIILWLISVKFKIYEDFLFSCYHVIGK